MNFDTRKKLFLFFPVLASLVAAVVDFWVPTHPKVISSGIPYFTYLMLIVSCGFAISAIIACINIGYRVQYFPKIQFYSVLMAIFVVMDYLTDKAMLLPKIYFPSVNNIIASAISEREILLTCMFYSLRLLICGILIGGMAGVLTGVIIGWNKTANYWLFPVIRFFGPMPTAIWIPIALLVFPNLFSASIFIVALTMWFPTTVQTSSGIQNVSKGYYDVANTLGASTLYQVLHIAIPAAAPQIFVGIFSGITTSFISLMLAELMGSKYGLGWYVNWKQQIMSYSEVWVALLILAILCYCTIRLLFILRKKFLSWQDGMIRW